MKKIIFILSVMIAVFFSVDSARAKHSLAPFAGYTPTYGFFLGGGYFYEDNDFDLDIEGVLTFVDAYQLMLGVHYNLSPQWKGLLKLEGRRGFIPYYGEGSRTIPEDRIDIFSDELKGEIGGIRRFKNALSFGMGMDFQWRREDRIKELPGRRAFPDETTAGIYLTEEYDKRDREKSPNSGFIQTFKIRHVPGFLISIDGVSSFTQLEASFSWFHELVTDWILASHIEGAVSFGEPTMLYRYQFGGSDQLRGFHANRFRGKHYFLQQTELRFPIAWILYGDLFVGIGDIGDNGLNRPRISSGAGILIRLPPDYLEVARIDFGVAEDQYGLFIDFGYAF